MMYWQCGYQLNQVLLTKLLIIADDLLKYGNLVCLWVLVPLHPFVSMGKPHYYFKPTRSWVNHSQTHEVNFCSIFTSYGVWSYGVWFWSYKIHTKYLPRVCDDNFCRKFFTHLCLCHLLTWHTWQFLTWLRMVRLIPLQFIVTWSVSSSLVCPSCCK